MSQDQERKKGDEKEAAGPKMSQDQERKGGDEKEAVKSRSIFPPKWSLKDLFSGEKINTEKLSPLRIVLIGKTGAGKSATGNTILQSDIFKSEANSCSVTKENAEFKKQISGRQISVVDTPGVLDTDKDMINKIKTSSDHEPNVFLLVIPLGRFHGEDKEAVDKLLNFFGEEATKSMIVLFTRGDELQGQNIDKCINQCSELKKVIKQCEGRYHVFDNVNKNHTQVIELMKKIDKMLKNKGKSTNVTNEKNENEIFEKKNTCHVVDGDNTDSIAHV